MREIKTVALIGLGAIGSFLASNLQRVLGENLRIVAGGARKERLERDGIVVNGVPFHFRVVAPEEETGYADLAIVITKISRPVPGAGGYAASDRPGYHHHVALKRRGKPRSGWPRSTAGTGCSTLWRGSAWSWTGTRCPIIPPEPPSNLEKNTIRSLPTGF